LPDDTPEMSRRTFLRAGAGVAGISTLEKGFFLGGQPSARPEEVDTVVVDSAASILSPEAPSDVLTRFVEQMRQGGVSCALGRVATSEDWPATMVRILAYSPFLESLGLSSAKSVGEIQAAVKSGKIAVVFHCQGSYMLGSPFGVSRPMVSTFDIRRLLRVHELGVRVMQLTDDFKGYLGDGCTERTDCGLTDYGIWALRKMNEIGMLVDCSHAGYQTSMDAINMSRQPIIFSHSNAKALCTNKRNITDEQIRAVATNGGVIGITAAAEMVDANAPTVDRLLDHIDYVVHLAGIDHVGMGFGYSYETAATYTRLHRDTSAYRKPPWSYAISDPTHISTVRTGLRARGYDEGSIRKVLGANFLRVFRQVWQA